MSSCCPSDVKAITTILGDTVTTVYLDTRVAPPVLLTQAEYDALTKVKCPQTETDFERLCLQVIGNTDAALIVEGMQCITKTTTYADENGVVAAVTIDDIKLLLNDGTDVTATHEVVACPTPIVVETEVCVA